MTITDAKEVEAFKNWLLGLLNDHKILVEFTKKDGTTRVMNCTKNLNLIPTEFHPKGSSDKNGTNIPVFDLDAKGWRSFAVESITKVNFDL